MTLPNLKSILEIAVYDAAKAIMNIYEQTDGKVEYKNDNSPVTEADRQGEIIITRILQKHYPNISIVAEEAVSNGGTPNISDKPFFLVDPLDGTKEFINKRTDFTVNIAMIKNYIPITGIIYAPARGEIWIGENSKAEKVTLIDNKEIKREPIHARKTNNSPKLAVISYSHSNIETQNYLKKLNITKHMSAGSSLKFCLIAEGKADIYPRFGRTMEWDTAAGDAILRCAGGRVVLEDGLTPLIYGKINQPHDSDFANPFFIADNQNK